jgi:hypothetical protein
VQCLRGYEPHVGGHVKAALARPLNQGIHLEFVELVSVNLRQHRTESVRILRGRHPNLPAHSVAQRVVNPLGRDVGQGGRGRSRASRVRAAAEWSTQRSRFDRGVRARGARGSEAIHGAGFGFPLGLGRGVVERRIKVTCRSVSNARHLQKPARIFTAGRANGQGIQAS